MKIRKIPPGNRVPTCRFYSDINNRLIECESPLERDYYQTLESKHIVVIQKYQEQPFPVTKHINGKDRLFYPDCLVSYKPITGRRPLLVEVKAKSDVEDPEKAPILRLKFKTLREYAKTHNMDFKIVFDTKIRGAYLDNLKFLYSYSRPRQFTDKYRDPILTTLQAGEIMTVNQILDVLSKNRQERALILPVIWHGRGNNFHAVFGANLHDHRHKSAAYKTNGKKKVLRAELLCSGYRFSTI